MTTLNKNIGYQADQLCNACGEVFETETLLTICPGCGAEVVSCGACEHLIAEGDKMCRNCVQGSKFKDF